MRALKRAEKVDPLSRRERKHLTFLEARVEGNWREIGNALAEIRDEKLYREDYPSFAAYLRGRWAYNRSQAYHLIAAAEAAEELSTVVDNSPRGIRPINERQVRPLLPLPKPQRRQAWDLAVQRAGGKIPTARAVATAVLEIMPPAPAARPAPAPREALQRALAALRSISHPTKNITAAIDLLSRELDSGGATSR